MGNLPLSAPKINVFSWNKGTAGGAMMQSHRQTMEDYEYHETGFVFPSWNLYMVLDGHGGYECASQVKEKLPLILSKYIRDDFAKEFEEETEPTNEQLQTAFLKAFRKTDEDLRESCKDDSGACCLVTITTPTKVIAAWCGDCALFRIQNDFSVHRMTKDHVPTLPTEEKRIVAANSAVYNGRVDGSLNISRAFGDFFFKPLKRERTIIKESRKRAFEVIHLNADTFPVICTPDVVIYEKQTTDLAFLLCSDGLLKVGMTEEELNWKDIFESKYKQGFIKPHQLATFLMDYAFVRKSLDNTTVTIVLNSAIPSTASDALFNMYLATRKQKLLGCVCDMEEICKSCVENGEQEQNIHMEE